jgi:hypothetical protein
VAAVRLKYYAREHGSYPRETPSGIYIEFAQRQQRPRKPIFYAEPHHYTPRIGPPGMPQLYVMKIPLPRPAHHKHLGFEIDTPLCGMYREYMYHTHMPELCVNYPYYYLRPYSWFSGPRDANLYNWLNVIIPDGGTRLYINFHHW